MDQQPAGPEQLSVALEEAASRTWWARVLYTLGSQSGTTQYRFVARTGDGRVQYASDTFPGPPLGRMPLEEAWAPGLQASLRQLRTEISGDGWKEAGRGTQPWDLTFVRTRS